MSSENGRTFFFQYDASLLKIEVEQQSEEEFIHISCLVASGVEITEFLMGELLEWNTQLPLGGFGLMGHTVVLRYTLLGGEHVDIDEFRTAFFIVAIAADRFDDKIIKAHGGQRASEMIKKHGNLFFPWY